MDIRVFSTLYKYEHHHHKHPHSRTLIGLVPYDEFQKWLGHGAHVFIRTVTCFACFLASKNLPSCTSVSSM